MTNDTPQQPDVPQPYGAQPHQQVPQPQYHAVYGDGTEQHQNRYGTQAYDPATGYGRVSEPAKFRTLLTATLVSLGLYLVSGVLGLVALPGSDELRRQLEGQEGLSPDQVDAAVAFSQAFSIGAVVATLVVGVALYLLVYLNLKKVRNWARILGIVFAILSIVSALGTVVAAPLLAQIGGGEATWQNHVVTALTVLVSAWWLVLAFNRDVADWFRAHVRRP